MLSCHLLQSCKQGITHLIWLQLIPILGLCHGSRAWICNKRAFSSLTLEDIVGWMQRTQNLFLWFWKCGSGNWLVHKINLGSFAFCLPFLVLGKTDYSQFSYSRNKLLLPFISCLDYISVILTKPLCCQLASSYLFVLKVLQNQHFIHLQAHKMQNGNLTCLCNQCRV